MNSDDHEKVKQIKELAADIREIKDFTQNTNFDMSFFNSAVSHSNPVNPAPEIKPVNMGNNKDWHIIILVLCVLGLFGLIAANALLTIDPKLTVLLMVAGLIMITFAIMSIHLKFNNQGATLIAAFFFIAVVLIGFEIFTPREIADKAETFYSSASQ
ncbi:hypothetical protein [uncultured Photobacterium sp.]|uniref:hypothetical protein n=1 Tax=uncultured Photobacterium sp. TaxID=173973 RepID=UPI00260609BB|nr:hypothetical protein [uncultured Photobacterium sp.]